MPFQSEATASFEDEAADGGDDFMHGDDDFMQQQNPNCEVRNGGSTIGIKHFNFNDKRNEKTVAIEMRHDWLSIEHGRGGS